MTGKFITFEGPDGAGKTSVLKEIVEEITPILGEQLIVTREPGGNPISEAIRKIIMDQQNTDMDPRTEALLFAAARRQHIVDQILPALAENKVVLCDRYVDSSVAYQGAGRQIGEQAVWEMNQFAINGLLPDLTIYFDVDASVGLNRIKNYRADEVNRLDREQTTFHQHVQQAYLDLQAKFPKRIKVIDASQPFAQVVTAAKQTILATYPNLF